MTVFPKIIREPLVAFLVLGTLLYAALAALRPDRDSGVVELRPETIRALIQNDEDLTGGAVTPERQAELIQGLIDDEVLLLEARAMGYDETDPRVRQRLLSIMRTSLTQTIADPTAAQLATYYRENLDQFRTDDAVSFEQVYFNFANESIPANPADFVKALNDGLETEQLGDYLQMSRTFPRQSRNRMVLVFGPAFADVLMAQEPGPWTGPHQSKHGIHYVRVKERHPAEQQTYEQVEPFLRQQWLFDEQRDQQQVRIDALREKYNIVLPPEYSNQ